MEASPHLCLRAHVALSLCQVRVQVSALHKDRASLVSEGTVTWGAPRLGGGPRAGEAGRRLHQGGPARCCRSPRPPELPRSEALRPKHPHPACQHARRGLWRTPGSGGGEASAHTSPGRTYGEAGWKAWRPAVSGGERQPWPPSWGCRAGAVPRRWFGKMGQCPLKAWGRGPFRKKGQGVQHPRGAPRQCLGDDGDPLFLDLKGRTQVRA